MKFFGEFNFKDIESDSLEQVKSLLWSFRHVFYNEKTPEQFRKGVKITPIKIRQKPGETARKQKLRRISDSKLAHLKKFVDDLTAQGVIEELDDATDCYASPIHIVLEERFVASKNAVVAKARCTWVGQISEKLAYQPYSWPNGPSMVIMHGNDAFGPIGLAKT